MSIPTYHVNYSLTTGNSNKSGILPFQCTPHSGNIPRGETQEVTVKFNPDHKDSYKDVVIVNLLNQVHLSVLLLTSSIRYTYLF